VVRAAEAVRATAGVSGVSVYGHTLRVFSRTGAELPRELEAALRSRDVVVRGIRTVAPTLEDVFMSLTRTAPDPERGR
jgi:hypothetical protein